VEEALAAIEARLGPRAAERPPGPYQVLGHQPADARAAIAASHERDRKRVDPGPWAGRVPDDLHRRLQRAARALDAAWDHLGDPARRALVDLQLAVVPPPRSRSEEERRALYAAAAKLQGNFAAANSSRLAAARPLADGAAQDLRAGRWARARNALRLAISYTPLDTRLWEMLEQADRNDPSTGRR